MIVYADITFIINFIMTFCICWAVGSIMGISYKWWRLFIASFAATVYLFTFLIIFLKYLSNVSVFFQIIIYIILNILAAALIINIAYPDLNRSRKLKALLFLYLIAFVSIGTVVSLYYITGFFTDIKMNNKSVLLIAGAIIIVILAKTGWSFFIRYSNSNEFYLPVEIFFNGQKLAVTGLVDTGNSLVDPLSGDPVIIISINELKNIFSFELYQKLVKEKNNVVNMVNIFNNFGWGDKIRILPFSTLGQEHGLLIGFRPDEVIIYNNNEVIVPSKIVVAINNSQLDPEQKYQVLIHPQLINF